MPQIYQASVTAPVNIAVIKYWGKRCTKLNLPTNSSLSVALSQENLRTLTTASCSEQFDKDILWLNGSEENVASNSRLIICIENLRLLRSRVEKENPGSQTLSKMNLHIVSENNFPTAAGLASSAAGFAALVYAIANLYKLPQSEIQLSRIARQGSGSACRSLFGGYTSWEMGNNDDGSDSQAQQVATKSHWPDMKAAILIISAAKKGVSSTSGMQATVATSTLFTYRAQHIVPIRMQEMKKAIAARDFQSFAELTIKDSNQFHAVCLDTMPPIFYLNDTSRYIIRLAEELNRVAGKYVAAYTFDAGPNAVLYYLSENTQLVLGLFRECYRKAKGWSSDARPCVPEGFNLGLIKNVGTGVCQVILTEVGDGPKETDESLINEKGLPR
ncbi:Diphosphomevalonate decarboxylase [Neolecta irregularis DAH-3]|uniref:Diphosphomevalonate decarboxylase n=1 Tax=Neolecta irregularis (strain DAH-3) TaxID=1198029 RepID=A0A1U7LJT3_NEOID|nr:Diphosphomevalonate decarboxylase [Neolecta irregularis DAH-3]|eukprot:OLL22907.1 Diphosphomevalonate decarboxylase [Neolecta irregularis DAH-3]